jgi:DNA-binding NarL/FixJ family response regulator
MSARGALATRTRVVIVEDHALFSESLAIALDIEGYDVRRIEPGSRSATGFDLLSAALRHHAGVVILDLDLGACGNGVRFIEPLSRAGASVIVVTGDSDRARWGECMRYGARRVLSKTGSLNDILATIRRIDHGLPVITREEREELLQVWHQQRSNVQELRTRLDLLTPRERLVLAHLMQGHQVREISRLNVVSEATVRTQVKSVLAKLEVSSQIAAVGLARQAGWRPPEL